MEGKKIVRSEGKLNKIGQRTVKRVGATRKAPACLGEKKSGGTSRIKSTKKKQRPKRETR